MNSITLIHVCKGAKNLKHKAYTKDFLMDLYQSMILQRRFDTSVGEYFMAGKIVGTTHLSVGQEASEVGACKALRKEDFITSTHRGHGHILAKGGDPKLVMAELFGKESGYCRGRGGSMHVTDAKLGILGANGIVGAGFPIACGSAIASRNRGENTVTACFFGDGATNHGTFHESLNMAAVWKLPVVFICENNGYGISVPIDSVSNTHTLSERAKAYNIPGVTIDGNDVLAVYETVHEYVERARNGEGPALIECMTFRHYGHNFGDSAWYRPDSYMEEAKKKDAIDRFSQYLVTEGFTSEDLDEVEKQVDVIMDEAVAFAENSPWPDPETAWDRVYSMDNERCVRR